MRCFGRARCLTECLCFGGKKGQGQVGEKWPESGVIGFQRSILRNQYFLNKDDRAGGLFSRN